MNMVNRTALANLKLNKGRNILIGIAVFLTTLLVFVIPTVGFGEIDLEFQMVNRVYPTYHAIYRNVDQKTAEDLSVHGEIEETGLRQDVARAASAEGSVPLIYMDEKALAMSKVTLEEGDWPKEREDIVVSQGMLELFGLNGAVGDTISLPYQPEETDGLGYEKAGVFRICGLLPTTAEQREKKSYSALVSRAFMEEEQPEGSRRYRVLMRLGDAESMSTDQIKARIQKIAADFGIPEGETAENGEYIQANYVDPAFRTGIAVVILVVVLAGIMTIYSICYVSILYKVQEYGKLKALGASGRQIRQIVFREGMLVAGIAVPLGLLVGTGLSAAAQNYFIGAFAVSQEMRQVMAQLMAESGGVVLKPWIYLMSGAVAFFTVAVSILRPMWVAAQISPVEAMRYDGGLKTGKVERKGWRELNLFRLTAANLSRNKKRTGITIVTLSLTGILFLVVSTVMSCANPDEIARNEMWGEFIISVDSVTDKMHPEKDWSRICRNNPLDEAMERAVLQVPGVEKIMKQSMIRAAMTDPENGEAVYTSPIVGFPEEYTDQLMKGRRDGQDFDYQELMNGDKILVERSILHWMPELEAGDKITLVLENGTHKAEREFEIAAICDGAPGLTHYGDFLLPEALIGKLADYNMNYFWSIEVDKKHLSQAEEQLRALTAQNENLRIQSLEDKVEELKTSTDFISRICYIFMAVLGGVGIMNLVNTMINSIYVRRRELGIMQAVGLSQKQMVRMLQMEGLFYTGGMLVLSLGPGSLAGYGAFLFAKEDRMFGIVSYHYPAVQAGILILVVLVIQILLTYVVTRNFKKQSMIERIRFSE